MHKIRIYRRIEQSQNRIFGVKIIATEADDIVNEHFRFRRRVKSDRDLDARR